MLVSLPARKKGLFFPENGDTVIDSLRAPVMAIRVLVAVLQPIAVGRRQACALSDAAGGCLFPSALCGRRVPQFHRMPRNDYGAT